MTIHENGKSRHFEFRSRLHDCDCNVILPSCTVVAMRTALVLLLAAAAAHGQYTETAKVTVVEIPVQVVGRDGEPVRGLTREDFEIVDEGRKREIAYFDVVDVSAPPSVAPPTAAADGALKPAAPPSRKFFLLLDGGLTGVLHVARAQKLAES